MIFFFIIFVAVGLEPISSHRANGEVMVHIGYWSQLLVHQRVRQTIHTNIHTYHQFRVNKQHKDVCMLELDQRSSCYKASTQTSIPSHQVGKQTVGQCWTSKSFTTMYERMTKWEWCPLLMSTTTFKLLSLSITVQKHWIVLYMNPIRSHH